MKFTFHEQLENRPNPSSTTKPLKHYICSTLKRDREKIKLPNCSRKFQRHRIQKRHTPMFWLRFLRLKKKKRIVNNFVNIYEHLKKRIIVHKTDFAHEPTPWVDSRQRIMWKRKSNKSLMFMNVHENRCHVHEMFIIYALETYCPQNQKKLTFS